MYGKENDVVVARERDQHHRCDVRNESRSGVCEDAQYNGHHNKGNGIDGHEIGTLRNGSNDAEQRDERENEINLVRGSQIGVSKKAEIEHHCADDGEDESPTPHVEQQDVLLIVVAHIEFIVERLNLQLMLWCHNLTTVNDFSPSGFEISNRRNLI